MFVRCEYFLHTRFKNAKCKYFHDSRTVIPAAAFSCCTQQVWTCARLMQTSETTGNIEGVVCNEKQRSWQHRQLITRIRSLQPICQHLMVDVHLRD